MLSKVFVTIEIFRKLKLHCVVLAKALLFLITPAFLLKLTTFFNPNITLPFYRSVLLQNIGEHSYSKREDTPRN